MISILNIFFNIVLCTKHNITNIRTKVFIHFFMAAAVNAHILYIVGGGEEMKVVGLVRGDKGFDLLSFIGLLIDQLCMKLPARGATDSEHPGRFTGCHVPFCYENLRDPKTGNEWK